MFSHFFETLRAKKNVNTGVFVPRKPKTTAFTMFFASGSKNHSFWNVFGQHRGTGLKVKRNIAPGPFMDDDPRDLSLRGGVSSVARSDNFLPAKHVD